MNTATTNKSKQIAIFVLVVIFVSVTLLYLTARQTSAPTHSVNESLNDEMTEDENMMDEALPINEIVDEMIADEKTDEAVENEPGDTTAPEATQPLGSSCDTLSAFDSAFLCYLNEHRQNNGKPAVGYSTKLAAVAQAHAAWMNTTGTFSHTGENNSDFDERCAGAGTTCDAENIAQGVVSPKALFELWKNSPGHNSNMLDVHTVAGIGTSGFYSVLLLN